MHGLPHRAGWAEFAGGYAIQSPLGTIWSTNITPSKSAGIGDYSEADFARAVRDGKAKDGSHLYPAMPYDACAGITDEDIAALYAYFMQGIAPVDAAPAQQTNPEIPFNLRFAMIGWNLFYAGSAPFAPDPALSEAENRRKYITDVLANCGSCHTPRGRSGRALGEDPALSASGGGRAADPPRHPAAPAQVRLSRPRQAVIPAAFIASRNNSATTPSAAMLAAQMATSQPMRRSHSVRGTRAAISDTPRPPSPCRGRRNRTRPYRRG